MTCIVGLVHDEITYIGGDSAGVSESNLRIRSFQGGDVLEYIPEKKYCCRSRHLKISIRVCVDHLR